MKINVLLFICIMLRNTAYPQSNSDIKIIPRPQSIHVSKGSYVFKEPVAIITDDDIMDRAIQLQRYLEPPTDLLITINPYNLAGSIIELKLNNELEYLGEEGYKLEVTEEKVKIAAFHSNGIFWGIQSLRQLLPKEIMREAKIKDIHWVIPCLSIEDKPRFQWRGLMIDYSRTFWNKRHTKRIIDILALYKMNVLHMHLTDDQGWRIEIKKYPELAEKASRFSEEFDEPEERQGYYTQDDIRELIVYASKKNITIIPEIEMPGHTAEVFAVYPELSCKGDTFKIHPFFKGEGIHKEVFCAGNERTFDFLENVLSEIIYLFPSEYIHIGGDEVPKSQWKECLRCQARIEKEGLKDEYELQSWFVKYINEYLTLKGKKLIGWNEILQGGLAPDAAVMFWHGNLDQTLDAARKGHQIVMTPTSHCYFDYTYERIPVEKVYSFDPVPVQLEENYASSIMGVQANFWSHIDRTEPAMSRQIFPRLIALSEVGWTKKENKDWPSFYNRLNLHYELLDLLDVYYYKE